MVVYHGTKSDFNIFDYTKIGQQGRAEGAGFYFTNNKDIAEIYGEPMEVYLSIKKPLAYETKALSPELTKKFMKRLAEIEGQENGEPIEYGYLSNYGDIEFDGLDKVLGEAVRNESFNETALDQISGLVTAGVPIDYVNRAFMETTGYDGVVAKGFSNEGNKDNTIYVAFFPTQIKSATGNVGTFDSTNPDIRFSKKNDEVGRDVALRELSRMAESAYDETATPAEAYDALFEMASPNQKSILRALMNDDLLGFDYPHQAIDELRTNADAYEVSSSTKSAISKAGNAVFMSRGAGQGLQLDQAQAIIDEIAKEYPAVPKVIVVSDVTEMPITEAILNEIIESKTKVNEALEAFKNNPTPENYKAALSTGVNDVEGLFGNGQIYINAGAINTPERLREVFAHEAIGHMAVENMLKSVDPKLFNKLAAQVVLLDKSGNKYIRELAKRVDETQPGLDVKARASEIIAQIAERGDESKEMTPVVRTLWQQINDAIKAFAKLVFNIKMTDRDVRDIVAMANRYARGEDVISVLTSAEPAFSRANRKPSRADGDNVVSAALEYLARDPEFFQTPASEAKDIYAIGKDIDPGFRIEKFGASMTREKGADRAWEVFVPNAKVRAGIVLTKGDKVWVDLQFLVAGTDRGSRIYAMAADYAHNNGKVLIGDPNGLSKKAFYRRNENMLSSALKHGTTRHLMPHTAQMNPEGYWTDSADRKFAESVRPLTWVPDDDVNNIKELVYNSYDAAVKNVPEIKDVIYDPATEQFQYTDGRPFTDEDSRRIATELSRSAHSYRAGSATLKRAALFNTFLRQSSGEGRRDLLGALVNQLHGRGLAPALRGVMYSRSSGQSQIDTPQFKAWFGDSVVTNNGKPISEGGKPLVVYHGTTADFTGFSKEFIGEGNGNADWGDGFYFTDNPDAASQYASGDGGNVIPTYLRITKPATNKVMQSSEVQNAIDDGMRFQSVQEVLSGMGYDGIVITHKNHGVEYVVFQPEQIKSTFNVGTFDSANPDIRFSRTGSKPPSTPSQSRLMPSWNAPEPSKFDNLIYALQDKNIDLRRVTQEIKKAGNEIDDRWNAYLQEELYHGRSAKRVQDFINTELNPLVTDMRMRGVTMAEFEEFLWNRHAEEANRHVAERNPDMPDGGSGIDTADARAYLEGLPSAKRKAYESLAKRIDSINAKSRQLLVDYGLESQATIDGWGEMFEYYVPLKREDMDKGFFSGMGTGQGYSVRGRASKERVGSRRAVADIIANIAQQREVNIVRGEKNRVATALVGLAKLNPNPEFWEVDRAPTTQKVINGMVENVTNANYKNMPNVITARVPDKTGKIVEHAVIFNDFDERAMRMAQSIKNMDMEELGVVTGALAPITRWLASVNTQYNPVFGLINITRDVQGALLNLESTPLKAKKKEVLALTGKALKGIYQEVRARRDGVKVDSEWSELWEEFELQGAKTGYRELFKGINDRADSIEKALDPKWWQSKWWGKAVSVNGTLTDVEQWLVTKPGKAIFNWLSDYNETLENSVRLAAYKVALDEGMSKQQAASLAKNLTVNFNRKGKMGRDLGSLYAFFNASVQGTARIAQTILKDGKLTPAGKKIVYGGMLLGSMQAVLLAAMGFDEDEPPEFIRDRNLIIPLPNKKYITIPMPLGYNAIPATGRIITEWAMSGFEDTPERATHLMTVYMEMFNPIGGAGSISSIVMPTALDPFNDLDKNRDWTGRPIAQEDFNSLDPTPGHSRAKDTASAIGKGLSYGLNSLSGGTEFTKGTISPTPDQIDYLIGQVTGGVGRETLKLEQFATSIVTGESLPAYKIPVLGRFYGDANGVGSQGSAFYNNIMEMNKHDREIEGLIKTDGDVDAYIAKHPEADLAGYATKVYGMVSKLRRQKRNLLAEGAGKEEIAGIEEEITDIMREFNEEVRTAKSAEAVTN